MERKARVNQLFLIFCISMSIWSFAYAFVYVSQENQYIWMKISAIGWCTFSSILLHVTLLFTENRIIYRRIPKLLIYAPSVLFFYMSVFLFGKESGPPLFIQEFFYVGDFIYHFTFLLTSIVLVAVWGYRAIDVRRKSQSKIIVVSAMFSFLLNLMMESIFPIVGIRFPLMGHLHCLILITGIYYAIHKYRLFEITPKLLIEEILQEMMDLVILVSTSGKIIKINDSTEKILGYSSNELLNQNITVIFEKTFIDKIFSPSSVPEIKRHSDVYCKAKDGVRIPISLSCSPIFDPDMNDILAFVLVGQDNRMIKRLEREIEEHKKAKEHIAYLANHDSLTGLPNRKYFCEILHEAINYAKCKQIGFAILFLDLDDLKKVNDTLGHDAGDQLLFEVAKRLKEHILETDIVARIGGDEFTLLLFGVDNEKMAKESAKKLLNSVSDPIEIYGLQINVNISIGASLFPENGDDPKLLIKQADSQMYLVKKSKKLSYAQNTGNI